MVKKILFAAVVLMGSVAVPRSAMAGCTTDLADCYERAAQVEGFWYRWAAGLDCELDFAECVRIKLVGA
jgi:hypothetical protein